MEKDIKQYKINVNNEKWAIKWQSTYDRSLLLFITGQCNLNCKNCFSISTRNSKEMTLDDIKNIIAANNDYQKIDLMGGEPLMHPKILGIIDYLKSINKSVSVYTNGNKLDMITNLDYPIRACISFHEIESDNPSRKPIKPIVDKIEDFVKHNNKIKLILLLDKLNYNKASDIIEFVDSKMPFINKLTIGLMRYENDYWNDNHPNVLPFEEYAKTIQMIVNDYDGRLDLDIFMKGVLEFDGNPGNLPNRVNRFKCIFQDLTYCDCLYNACDYSHPKLRDDFKLPECLKECKHTKKKKCLADKVRLLNKRKK